MKGLILWDKQIYGPEDYQDALKNPNNDSVSCGLMEAGGENGFYAFYAMIINENSRTRKDVKNDIHEQALEQWDNIVEEIWTPRKKCDFYVVATHSEFRPVYDEIFKGEWRNYEELGVKGKIALHDLMEKIDSGEFS